MYAVDVRSVVAVIKNIDVPGLNVDSLLTVIYVFGNSSTV